MLSKTVLKASIGLLLGPNEAETILLLILNNHILSMLKAGISHNGLTKHTGWYTFSYHPLSFKEGKVMAAVQSRNQPNGSLSN